VDLTIHVTETEEDLIYKLDPHTKKSLEGKISIHIASKIHIGCDTKIDYEYYHNDFENYQVPSILTGLSCNELKDQLNVTALVYYRTLTGETKRVQL
jgi:hypothetical protein